MTAEKILGWACGENERDKKRTQNVGGEISRKTTT
jgi:hypothetical protein